MLSVQSRGLWVPAKGGAEPGNDGTNANQTGYAGWRLTGSTGLPKICRYPM
jgi:hypothetical protein